MAHNAFIIGNLADQAAAAGLLQAVGFTVSEFNQAAPKRLAERLKRSHPAVLLVDAGVSPGTLRSLATAVGAPGSQLLVFGDHTEQDRFRDMAGSGQAIYLCQPVRPAYLKELLTDIYEDIQSAELGSAPVQQPYSLDQFGELYGSCAPMRSLYRFLRRAAGSEAVLCIHGESGTGKELVAKAVHAYSAHSTAAFEAINCAAIPAELVESELFGHEKGSFSGAISEHIGIFERVGHGTLLLDEITEMPKAMQVKLLRVLESGKFRRVGGEVDKTYHARVIAATNRNPADAVVEGSLREDLYYRISQLEIKVPALRERGGDIVGLARLFLKQFNTENDRQLVLAPGAEKALASYHWPGNVRQLWNVIQKASTVARLTVKRSHLPLSHSPRERNAPHAETVVLPADCTLAEVEEIYIKSTLARLGGDKPGCAKALGVSLRTLYSRLKTYEHRRPTA